MSKHWQEGTLRLRKGKRRWTWYAWYRAPQVVNGRIAWVQICKALGTIEEIKGEKAARRKLDEILSKINSPDYRATTNITFREFAVRWMEQSIPALKRSTQEVYRSALNKHLVPYFGNVKLADFNMMIVQAFATKHSDHPVMIGNVITVMRSMWGDARRAGFAPKDLDPFDGLRMPQPSVKKKAAFFTEQQIKLILRCAEEPYRTFFRLAGATGLRAGELCGLRIEDLDVAGRQVVVRQSIWRGKEQNPKSENAQRSCGIGPQLLEKLQELCGDRPAGETLFATDGNPWNDRFLVQRILHPILERLWIPYKGKRIGIHAFRHGNATMMDEENVPLKTRQRRLGHGSVELTLGRYTHPISKDDMDFAEKVDERLTIQ